MRLSRLYSPVALHVGQALVLDEESAHYLRTVLRLKSGSRLVLFNGQGGEYSATLSEVTRKTVVVSIEQRHERTVESPLNVLFGLGISRGERMDFAVQKAVELGVTAITPLNTARCNVVLKAEKGDSKRQHWQKIAQHASEQSGRTIVPPLHEIIELEQWVTVQTGLKIFLDPYAKSTLNQLQPAQNTVTLLSGPEGGFTDSEREIAKAAGFIPVSLGQRILRAETAALAALSCVQLLWGDFSI
jgi:16S rRNA (uracil1498-N3)-methyltransferase